MHFFGAGTVNSGSKVATAGSGSNSILPGEWTEDGNGGHPDILASWSIGGDTGDAFVDLWPALAFITGCCAERKEVRTCRPGKKLRQPNISIMKL